MAEYCVYTVGHGELSWDSFAKLVRPHHINLFIDIRSIPYVDYAPWFNRDRLESMLRKQGWEYMWSGGSLGPLTSDGRFDCIAKEVDPRYREGIKELLAAAGQSTVCLLGSPADPMGSHRHQLISQTLLKHNVMVRHILHNGETMAAQSDLFHMLPK